MYKSFPRILRTRIDWQVIKSHHQRSPERHLSACALHLLQQNPSISRFQDNIATKSEHFSFSNGKPVGLIDQVAVALRRLGSGDSFVVIGDSFGLSHSTVSQITWRFVESMEERALHHLQWPSTQEKNEYNQVKICEEISSPRF
jgi:hypothetical protein